MSFHLYTLTLNSDAITIELIVITTNIKLISIRYGYDFFSGPISDSRLEGCAFLSHHFSGALHSEVN